jgi:hypothetical protein
MSETESTLRSFIRGTLELIFQLGPGGPQVKNNAGAVEIRNPTDSGFVVARANQPAGDNDLVDRQTFYDNFANPNDPYVYTFENASAFGGCSGSPVTPNEVQYVRVWLVGGRTITKMRTFIVSGADGVNRLQFAIYSQMTPESISGAPNAQVAATAANTPTSGTTGLYDVPLVTPYVVPASGFYWLAVQTDNDVMAFTVSVTYRAGSVNRLEEAMGSFALPSPAGVTTQPQSAIIYVAAVE